MFNSSEAWGKRQTSDFVGKLRKYLVHYLARSQNLTYDWNCSPPNSTNNQLKLLSFSLSLYVKRDLQEKETILSSSSNISL